jgi:hypothetical protein
MVIYHAPILTETLRLFRVASDEKNFLSSFFPEKFYLELPPIYGTKFQLDLYAKWTAQFDLI